MWLDLGPKNEIRMTSDVDSDRLFSRWSIMTYSVYLCLFRCTALWFNTVQAFPSGGGWKTHFLNEFELHHVADSASATIKMASWWGVWLNSGCLCQSTLHRCSIYFNVNGRRAAAFSLVRGRWIFRSFGKSQPTCTTPKVIQNVRVYLGKLKNHLFAASSLEQNTGGTCQKVGHSRLGQGEFWSSHLLGVNEVDALGGRLWLWQFHFCPKAFGHFA